MATKKQKKELMEILKFTPTNIRLSIQGYGGECYIGEVSRETYNVFKEKKVDLEQYAGDWDNEYYQDIPTEHRFFEPGSAYECDNLCHASGATMDSSSIITIDDEKGNTIWECSLDIDSLEKAGVTVNTGGDEYDSEDAEDGTVIFWGGQGEKGCFFDGEFTLKAPFDPKKLSISYSNADGWLLSSSVEYDGEEIDGTGGYSTTGKWAEHKFWIAGDEEVYEGVERDEAMDEDSDDHPEANFDEDWNPAAELDKITEESMSEWFPVDSKPVRKGEYEVMIDAEWPLGGLGRAQWSGRIWKDFEGKKIKIKTWRGLKFDPQEMLEKN